MKGLMAMVCLVLACSEKPAPKFDEKLAAECTKVTTKPSCKTCCERAGGVTIWSEPKPAEEQGLASVFQGCTCGEIKYR